MAGKCKLRGALPYDESLAHAFRRTRVSIDASSGPFINGFSFRLLSCFAAGGFVLTNREADIFRPFGPLADEICYQSANEFGAKLEHFLAHYRKRHEVTQEIGAIVRATLRRRLCSPVYAARGAGNRAFNKLATRVRQLEAEASP
jgi:hypothetical protein